MYTNNEPKTHTNALHVHKVFSQKQLSIDRNTYFVHVLLTTNGNIVESVSQESSSSYHTLILLKRIPIHF